MDTANIKALASAIASDNPRALERLYGKGRIPPAVYSWHFDRQGLIHQPLQALYDAWLKLGDTAPLLDPDNGEPRALAAEVYPYLMVVEPDEDYATVSYRYYGAAIAKAYGQDLTGRSSSAFGSAIATFFVGAYLATEVRAAPLLTRHRAPPTVAVKHWQRLILPPAIINVGGQQQPRFLAANVPEWD